METGVPGRAETTPGVGVPLVLLLDPKCVKK
jgi:hypothetical protein